MKVGVKGLKFDSAHYTRGSSAKCLSLHGHTFSLEVEVEGEIDPKTGMVMDFADLKSLVNEIIKEYDHKLIIPRRDFEKIKISGPFMSKLKFLDYPEATTEYIALDIAKKLHNKVGKRVTVKLYEGKNNYVETVYP
ncbi:6-carboxytetrahydropterin synthase [Candidatus Bathyarchaeota archaeon]|nr:MAG: 6-carboxytetrahydropterin synthase [Candidatus Bathyarchaeota archaeon]